VVNDWRVTGRMRRLLGYVRLVAWLCGCGSRIDCLAVCGGRWSGGVRRLSQLPSESGMAAGESEAVSCPVSWT
jgi:hypothetical protein